MPWGADRKMKISNTSIKLVCLRSLYSIDWEIDIKSINFQICNNTSPICFYSNRAEMKVECSDKDSYWDELQFIILFSSSWEVWYCFARTSSNVCSCFVYTPQYDNVFMQCNDDCLSQMHKLRLMNIPTGLVFNKYNMFLAAALI